MLPSLMCISEHETKQLLHELADLPPLDLSLVLRLPDLLTPELGRLLRSLPATNPPSTMPSMQRSPK